MSVVSTQDAAAGKLLTVVLSRLDCAPYGTIDGELPMVAGWPAVLFAAAKRFRKVSRGALLRTKCNAHDRLGCHLGGSL